MTGVLDLDPKYDAIITKAANEIQYASKLQQRGKQGKKVDIRNDAQREIAYAIVQALALNQE